MLSILLLGAPQVLRDAEAVTIPRRRSRALLYYLAAQGTPITREHLLAFFWPDYPRADAQHQLRTALHGLRATLGSAIEADEQTIALSSATFVDVRQLDAAQREEHDKERLAAALETYRSEFLDGFLLNDVPAFDDWLASERERYRRMIMRGFARLSEYLAAEGRLAAARDTIDRALRLDPLQEDLQRTAIRLTYLAGNRAGAIRRFEQLRDLLDQELGVPPMDETQALYDAIVTDMLPRAEIRSEADKQIQRGQTERGTHVLVASQLPFVGREVELSAVEEGVRQGKLVLVEGAMGSGKTRLITTFLSRSDWLVLRGSAHELEQSLPYQPIITALRHLFAQPEWQTLRPRLALPSVWMDELARLAPEIQPTAIASASAPADEARLWESVAQLLFGLASLRPTALFLDDLHWADSSTIALLGYLVRRVGEQPSAALLATTHSLDLGTPTGRLVTTLLREERLHSVSLSPLTAHDTATLAHQIAVEDASFSTWLGEQAEGNPLVLNELIREARVRGILDTNGRFNPPPLGVSLVPPTVATLVRARLHRISNEARRLLDVATLLGRRFGGDIAAQAAALSEEAALDALDELNAAGLILPETDDIYTFDHTLTREVAHQELAPARQRLLHRRIAEILEKAVSVHREDRDGRIAQHFAAAGLPERAAPYAFHAGQRAARLAAWNEAILFFKQALVGADTNAARTTLLALGRAQLNAGQLQEATESIRQALEHAKMHSSAATDEARLALIDSLMPQGRFAEIMELVQEWSPHAEPHAAGHVEFFWGVAFILQGLDLAAAIRHLRAAEALILAQPQVDQLLLLRIRSEVAIALAEQGHLEETVAIYRAAIADTDDSADPALLYWLCVCYNNLAYHLHLLGDPAAQTVAEQGLFHAHQQGVLGVLPFLHSTLAEIALDRGAFDTAEQMLEEGLTLARRLDMTESIIVLTANRGRLAAQRGNLEEAQTLLQSSLNQAEAMQYPHLTARIRLWLIPLLPPDDALGLLASVRAFAASSGRHLLLAEADRLASFLDGKRETGDSRQQTTYR